MRTIVIIRKMCLRWIPYFQCNTKVQISCHQDSPLVVFAEDLAATVRIGISEDLNKLLRRTYSAQFLST